ncbi:hypothetical protein K440DRAFT_664230 [Wilcoxina mikolae CBS 423.85]|nr:hypothetical protein K440DRAFT_664230 [Wilcoxina mikolae CBS 423.85]
MEFDARSPGVNSICFHNEMVVIDIRKGQSGWLGVSYPTLSAVHAANPFRSARYAQCRATVGLELWPQAKKTPLSRVGRKARLPSTESFKRLRQPPRVVSDHHETSPVLCNHAQSPHHSSGDPNAVFSRARTTRQIKSWGEMRQIFFFGGVGSVDITVAFSGQLAVLGRLGTSPQGSAHAATIRYSYQYSGSYLRLAASERISPHDV